MSIILVGKRHRTRLSPTRLEDSGGRIDGLKPGTEPPECDWDFFQHVHSALRDTAGPTNYYMAYDEIFTGTGTDENTKAHLRWAFR